MVPTNLRHKKKKCLEKDPFSYISLHLTATTLQSGEMFSFLRFHLTLFGSLRRLGLNDYSILNADDALHVSERGKVILIIILTACGEATNDRPGGVRQRSRKKQHKETEVQLKCVSIDGLCV